MNKNPQQKQILKGLAFLLKLKTETSTNFHPHK